MCQFRNFLKLDSENAALYEFPQECLKNENKPGIRNGSSKPGTTYEEPYLLLNHTRNTNNSFFFLPRKPMAMFH